MKQRYLEITYRKGRPIAAYLYLPRKTGDTSARTAQLGDGFIVDYAADGRPIGVEMTAPSLVSLERLNRVLAAINEAPATAEDVRPLAA